MLDLYELAWRPAAALIGRTDAQVAHDRTQELLRRADGLPPLAALARLVHRAAFAESPVVVGGVRLPHPVVLAAGLVKGAGFPDEGSAMAAVAIDRNIVAGWRSMPALVGAVELGSFTRHPRLGHPGRVVWRDNGTRSMQNRIGLRNPGARAGAAYLRAHAADLPPVWGVSIAMSPGLADLAKSEREVAEAAAFFVGAFARGPGDAAGPAWLTLNLSCPNTEDDPRGAQSGELAARLCGALTALTPIPLWVKVGPDLSDAQLRALVAAFGAAGVRAVIATNTLARPVPGGAGTAGLSGAGLRPHALETVARLARVIDEAGATLDIVACGGILRGHDLLAFEAAGARAAMVYSALVFRGPLAGALILREARRGRRHD